jgi:hypothetical protein
MKRGILVAGAFAAFLAVTACGTAPTPTPTQAPPPTAAPKPTETVQPTLAPTLTQAPEPTATTVPPTSAPQPTATTAQATAAPATSALPTATTAPTAAPPTSAPPGLYVSSIQLNPNQPAHAQDISFSVSFLNTANGDQNQKWVIYIYRADNPTRINQQTAVTQSTFPPGATTLQALPPVNFGVTGNACDYYFAQVDSIDINNKGTPLTQPNGQALTKGFAVCQ